MIMLKHSLNPFLNEDISLDQYYYIQHIEKKI